MMHSLSSPESSIAMIRSFPSLIFFTLLDHMVGHSIDTPPRPLGKLKPVKGS